jgi:hypothetical protein
MSHNICAIHEGAPDCLIWRNASKEYKQQALELDDQMREILLVAKASNPQSAVQTILYSDVEITHHFDS